MIRYRSYHCGRPQPQSSLNLFLHNFYFRLNLTDRQQSLLQLDYMPEILVNRNQIRYAQLQIRFDQSGAKTRTDNQSFFLTLFYHTFSNLGRHFQKKFKNYSYFYYSLSLSQCRGKMGEHRFCVLPSCTYASSHWGSLIKSLCSALLQEHREVFGLVQL